MTNHLTRTCILAFVLFASLSGCSDDPSSLGAGLLLPGDTPVVRRDTIQAISHSSARTILGSGSSERILLGKADAVESWAFLQFFQFPESLTAVTLTRATVRLHSMYHYGDSAAPFSYSLHRVVRVWGGDSLTCDSLLQRESDYVESVPLLTIPGHVLQDTSSEEFEIPDTSLIRQWIMTPYDTTARNFGIALKPRNTSVIKGFWSFNAIDPSVRPELRLEYTKDGAANTYSHTIGGARFLATVPQSSLVTDTAFIYIQNGISYRGLLTFDVAGIPRGAVINQATLELTRAASGSQTAGLLSDSLYVAFVGTSGALEGTSYRVSSVTQSGNIHRYQFDVRQYVQSWLASATVPRRISILGYHELSALDLFVLNGSSAASDLRPRIRITYTISHP